PRIEGAIAVGRHAADNRKPEHGHHHPDRAAPLSTGFVFVVIVRLYLVFAIRIPVFAVFISLVVVPVGRLPPAAAIVIRFVVAGADGVVIAFSGRPPQETETITGIRESGLDRHAGLEIGLPAATVFVRPVLRRWRRRDERVAAGLRRRGARYVGKPAG